MGSDAHRKMGGLICIKHFRNEDLRTSKDNKIYQLVSGAIPIAPIVDSIEKEEISERSERGNENQEC